MSLDMRRYTCNGAYFRRVETQEQAYWLGFLSADGCVKRNRASFNLTIALAEQDRAHIQAFLDAIGANNPISYEARTASCRVAIYSDELIADLSRYGVEPRKSSTLRWPSLPPALLRHYLRGYFDGDGCIHLPKTRPAYQAWFSIVSNLAFLEGCQEYLQKTLGFRKTKLGMWNKSAGYQYGTLVRSGGRQLRAFYDHIYADATIWLDRKRSHFPCHPERSQVPPSR